MPAAVTPCHAAVCAAIQEHGSWLPFDAFLHIVLHHPHTGYYGSGRVQLGKGGDFYTAPQLSPLFAQVLAQAFTPLLHGGDMLELGAGDGTLAEQLLHALPPHTLRHYYILETSPALAARQRKRLATFPQVQWCTTLPTQHDGVILANEVLDCVPFRLLTRADGSWRERGVVQHGDTFAFARRDLADASDTAHLPPLPDGYESEFSPQATALTQALATCLRRGLVLLADYGFPRAEYYHPQRAQGTMLCYRQQRVDADPLQQVGEKDITAHIDFTAIAEAGLAGGAEVAGFVTQAQGLINGGITALLARCGDGSGDAAYLRAAAGAQKLLAPQEMGELIKWMGLSKGLTAPLPLFAAGDRRHCL